MRKQADLSPPLGWDGGICKVVERIEDTVPSPALQDALQEKVEKGQKLTNPEAAKVYTLDRNRGGGLFGQIQISPHAQYRMDQRAITVGDLRVFFADFSRKLNDWKSQRAWEYDQYMDELRQGQPVYWVDKRLGDLRVVFSLVGRDVANVVTVYWEGEPDPRPGTCQTRTARDEDALSGYRTMVKDPHPTKSDTDTGKYPTQALPSPPWSRSKPLSKPVTFQGPGESGSDSSGTVHEDKARTKGVPGDQSPPADPPARIGPVRRPGMSTASVDPFAGMDPALIAVAVRLAGMIPPAYPTGGTRHHKQRGEAYRYFHQRYREQRGTIIQNQKRRYKRLKSNPQFLRDRERRKKSPERFETKPSGGAVTLADRAEKARKKKALEVLIPVPVYFYAQDQWGLLLDVSPRGKVHYELGPRRRTEDLETFFDQVVIGDEDMARLEAYMDALFEYRPDGVVSGDNIEDTTFDAWAGPQERQADFLRETRPPEMAPETRYDRANDHGDRKRQDRTPGTPGLYGPYEKEVQHSNPGSRVLPSGAGHIEKDAALIQDIQRGCSPDLGAKAQGLKVSLRRVDAANAMWLFDVQGSKEPYRVRLQAIRKGNVKAIAKVHVRVSCSCPFWQYQGPEHWAAQEKYLYGKPRGLATTPDVRDPNGEHRACKHVLAALAYVSSRQWDIPEVRSKQAGLRYLADILDQGVRDRAIERLAVRYLVAMEVL